jgi:hypothetical protein
MTISGPMHRIERQRALAKPLLQIRVVCGAKSVSQIWIKKEKKEGMEQRTFRTVDLTTFHTALFACACSRHIMSSMRRASCALSVLSGAIRSEDCKKRVSPTALEFTAIQFTLGSEIVLMRHSLREVYYSISVRFLGLQALLALREAENWGRELSTSRAP